LTSHNSIAYEEAECTTNEEFLTGGNACSFSRGRVETLPISPPPYPLSYLEGHMEISIIDSYFYALVRVIDDIYNEEDLADILYFIVSLATELTGAKGCTIRVLEHGTFDLKVISSYGLSEYYLKSGAIDYGKSITEITQGDIIMIEDFEHDPRIQNIEAARREGVKAVVGIPFTVNETTYSILRVYFSQERVPTQQEMELLCSLGRLSCLAIDRAVIGNLRRSNDEHALD
jgi:hypothetical protein